MAMGRTNPEAQHDPGGKVKLALPDGVTGDAHFSACGRYRQNLTRDWTPAGDAARSVLFVGMNPSVASAEISDPTCHRELGFAQSWGLTRYLKGNMLDWRSTCPREIPHDPALACSPDNIPALLDMAQEAEFVVLAYGRLHPRFAGIVDSTLSALEQTGKPLHCLGRNKDGSAKHPLYLAKTTPLQPFSRIS
ncbi:hypothetical protein LCGC14_2736060 [marine sediment metagenome]|uniref:DUF1643 domain-containing protein n=1 Tax=marine sediment metagenome TaxID=412755 RepID=A0A0F8ZT30_9ZZZZ